MVLIFKPPGWINQELELVLKEFHNRQADGRLYGPDVEEVRQAILEKFPQLVPIKDDETKK